MTDAQATIRSTHRRAVLIGGVLPVLIAAVGTALMFSWMPELPDPIATHWSGSEPDGFGPAWLIALTPLGIVLAYAVFAIAASWAGSPAGRIIPNQKFLLVTGVWLSSCLTVGITRSVSIQRGLADAADAGGGDAVGLSLLFGGILGLGLAVAAWFLLPRADSSHTQAPAAEPLAVTETERVSWSRTVRLGAVALIMVGGGLLISIVTIVYAAITGSPAVWIGVIVLAAVLLLALATAVWRVSADRRGLIVRSGLGWPRVVIPTDDIREVTVITVKPTADFGGWGWRWDAAGRQGIIMRAGSAIQVTRASGKRFVVTVDDAGTGASVLAALVSPTR
jgi:hypothetical protein